MRLCFQETVKLDVHIVEEDSRYDVLIENVSQVCRYSILFARFEVLLPIYVIVSVTWFRLDPVYRHVDNMLQCPCRPFIIISFYFLSSYDLIPGFVFSHISDRNTCTFFDLVQIQTHHRIFYASTVRSTLVLCVASRLGSGATFVHAHLAFAYCCN